MAALYEITQQMSQLAEMLADGEIDEQVYNDTIENLGIDGAVDELIKAIRNKDAEADMYEREADKLYEKMRQAEKSVENMKRILSGYLENVPEKKVKTSLFSAYKATKKVSEVYGNVPSEYMIEQEPKVDRARIFKDLKAGKDVAGARLIEKSYVAIR